MGQLKIMSREAGHTTVEWTDAETEAEARRIFDQLRSQGHIAFKLDESPGHEADEVLRDFDPDAELVVMSPAVQGG